MQRSTIIILLALGVAAMQTADLVVALRTGRARGRGGTITRKGRPRRFWRYIYSAYALLLLCAGAILWALISPQSFQ
jgi:hypothetical protein